MTEQLDAANDLADLIDREGANLAVGDHVSDVTVAALRAAGLCGLFVPTEVGGAGLSLVDTVEVIEALSRADGSTGWCWFASDMANAYFSSYLPDSGVERVYADGVPMMAGQFAPNGVGERVDHGWVVTGDYQFGSGIVHAEWAGAGFLGTRPGQENPDLLFTCYPAELAELKGNWDVLGLQATASFDYSIRDVEVPDDQCFDFFAPVVHRGGPVYSLGVLPLTAAGHAGWALGVTRRALDELRDLAAGTLRMGASSTLADSERFLVEYGTLESRYLAVRAWVRQTCVDAEAEADAHGEASEKAGLLLRQTSVRAKQEGADIARQAYLLAGTQALRDGPLQRVFRDLHAGSQHFFGGILHTTELAQHLLKEAAGS